MSRLSKIDFIVPKLAIGTTTAATAQLDVTQTVNSEIMRLTATATNDDPRHSVYHDRGVTTSATAAGSALSFNTGSPTHSFYGFRAYVWAIRTGGSSGTADDAAFFELCWATKAGVQIGSDTLRVFGRNQAAWTCASSIAYGINVINYTGAANNNVSWHSEWHVYGPLGAATA